jgi:predicted trehalose synthase
VKRITLLIIITVASAVLAGAAVLGPGPAPLTGTLTSPEALAAAVLDGLVRKDRPALERLALTGQEFAAHVWPALPAARPERNLTAQYVWGDLSAKSRMHLANHLSRTLPAGARITAIDFEGESSHYGRVTVRRDSVITLADAEGRSSKVRLFGSMIEHAGRYKVFSYVTD